MGGKECKWAHTESELRAVGIARREFEEARRALEEKLERKRQKKAEKKQHKQQKKDRVEEESTAVSPSTTKAVWSSPPVAMAADPLYKTQVCRNAAISTYVDGLTHVDGHVAGGVYGDEPDDGNVHGIRYSGTHARYARCTDAATSYASDASSS